MSRVEAENRELSDKVEDMRVESEMQYIEVLKKVQEEVTAEFEAVKQRDLSELLKTQPGL